MGSDNVANADLCRTPTISVPTENERAVTGMDEYIDRESLLSIVKPDDPSDEKYAITIATAKKLIRSFVYRVPSADVAPVRHGRWIEPSRLYYGAKQYECSLCWVEAFWDKHGITEKYPCCPKCGAKMDLEVMVDGC